MLLHITRRVSLPGLLSGLFAILTSSGCSRSEEPVAAPAAKSGGPSFMQGAPKSSRAKPVIALILESLASERGATMADVAKQHATEHQSEYELIVSGIPDDKDVPAQVTLIEGMMAQRVSAIVVSPVDVKTLVPTLARVMARGVSVVNIENRLDPDQMSAMQLRIPYVGTDDRSGAKKLAEFLVSRLKSGDETAVLPGTAPLQNNPQVRMGFEEGLIAGGLKTVDLPPAATETDGVPMDAAAVLAAHPELKAILISDPSIVPETLEAVKATGKTDIQIVAYGIDAAIRQSIQQGRIAAAADLHRDQAAVAGIEYALEILKNRRGETNDRATPVDLVTASKSAE